MGASHNPVAPSGERGEAAPGCETGASSYRRRSNSSGMCAWSTLCGSGRTDAPNATPGALTEGVPHPTLGAPSCEFHALVGVGALLTQAGRDRSVGVLPQPARHLEGAPHLIPRGALLRNRDGMSPALATYRSL